MNPGSFKPRVSVLVPQGLMKRVARVMPDGTGIDAFVAYLIRLGLDEHDRPREPYRKRMQRRAE